MDEIFGIILLVLAVLAGGGLVVFLQNLNKSLVIKLLLSLSGGFLISIAFIHFIPEIYLHNGGDIGYYILLGFLVQLFLEYFSGGVEHGHIHVKHAAGVIPWGLFISLSIHAFIEGIPLEGQFHNDHIDTFFDQDHSSHGHSHVGEGMKGLLLGVVLHKIPVAIALMTLMLASGFSKIKAWIVLFVFSLMGPLGVLFGHYGSAKAFLDLDVLMAIVIGMFLHISTTIIFESSENHRFNFAKLISLLVGVLLAVISL